MVSVGGAATNNKKSVLPQSSGKWLRVLIVVQQQSFSCPIIIVAHQTEPS